MEKIEGLRNISWEQIKDMTKDKEFISNIDTISHEELKQEFKKFNIWASDDEVRIFKQKVNEIINTYGETEDRKLKKELIKEEELEEIIGGGIIKDTLLFAAGVAAACFLCNIGGPELMAAFKDKFNFK